MNLYQLRDIKMAAMTPISLAAWAGRQALDNPLLSPFRNEMTQSLVQELATLEKHTRIHDKPSFKIDQVIFRGVTIDVTETNELAHPFCNLVHFNRTSQDHNVQEHIADDPKLLILPPLSGHFASILRDTIKSMLPSHDVYIADWIDAKKVPVTSGSFDFEDQISLIADMIRHIGPNVHILAVTQASFAALSAVAFLTQQKAEAAPKSLTIMGGPIDPRKTFVQLQKNAKEHSLRWFEENHIELVPPYYIGATRKVYPGFLQLQNRMDLVLSNSSHEIVKYFQHLVRGDEEDDATHEQLYDEFLAVMDVPAELYLQFIERAYCQCALATGKMTCHDNKIDLTSIKETALLAIEAELDDLSPPGQTRAALDLCSALPSDKKQSHLEIGVGHYGIFSGKKWRRNIQPIIHEFIRKNS